MVTSPGSSVGKGTLNHQGGKKKNLEIHSKCDAMSDSIQSE